MFMSATSDDAANIAAINAYIMSQPLKTAEAGIVRNEWLKFHEGLGWYSSKFPSVEDYDKARNIRNRFNDAQAVTAKEQTQVLEQRLKGLTSEELRGETRRTTTEGNYLEDEASGGQPWLPTKTKFALAIGALVIGGAMIAKRIYIDPALRMVTGR
jgi:hypothetical protein